MQASRRNIRYGKASGLVPDYFCDTVRDIDIELLAKHGVKYLVFDVDHTLTYYNGNEIDPKTAAYLNGHVIAGHLQGLYLASNTLRDLSPLGADINAPSIRASLQTRKPQKRYFAKVLATIGCQPHEVAMVGDRLINDIWGGNRSGMVTILVKPVGPDLLFDRLILRRYFGNRYLKKQR